MGENICCLKCVNNDKITCCIDWPWKSTEVGFGDVLIDHALGIKK